MSPLKVRSKGERERTRWFTEGTFYCIRCGSPMTIRGSITSHGVRIATWKCPKDGEELLEPEANQRALVLNKLRRGIEVKVGELNGAPYVRLTKEAKGVVHKGDVAAITLTAPDELRIKLRHAHPSPG